MNSQLTTNNGRLDYARFLNFDNRIAASSAETYRHVLRKFGRYLEGRGVSWEGIGKQTIIDFMHEQREAGLKNSSINTTVKSLKRLYNSMKDKGRIKENPCEGIGYFQESADARTSKGKWLTEEQLRAVFGAARQKKNIETRLRDSAALAVLFYTGVRANELSHLRWKDLEPEGRAGEMFIQCGKGDKSGFVEVDARVLAPLKAYREHLESIGVNEEMIFLTVPTKMHPARRPIDRKVLYYEIRRLGESVGLRISPHKFRHSMASHALKGGADIISVSHRLRHASAQITMDIYCHTDDKAIEYLPTIN